MYRNGKDFDHNGMEIAAAVPDELWARTAALPVTTYFAAGGFRGVSTLIVGACMGTSGGTTKFIHGTAAGVSARRVRLLRVVLLVGGGFTVGTSQLSRSRF